MIVKGNKPIFFNLHSSFFISEGDAEEDDFSIRKGACFSSSEGEAFSIEDADIQLDKIEAGKSLHLGIRRDKTTFNPVEARLYYGEEKEDKKGDEENAWTWIKLIDEDGSIGALDNDILLAKPIEREIGQKDFFIFEEYENETILKFSHHVEDLGRTLKTLTPSQQGESVLIEKTGGGHILIPLIGEEKVVNKEEATPIAIVNIEKRLIVPL